MKIKKKLKKEIKIRHSWSRNPVEKVHSTKKGKKGYKRDKFDFLKHEEE